MVDHKNESLTDQYGADYTATAEDKQWYFDQTDKDGDNQVSFEEFVMSGFFTVY